MTSWQRWKNSPSTALGKISQMTRPSISSFGTPASSATLSFTKVYRYSKSRAEKASLIPARTVSRCSIKSRTSYCRCRARSATFRVLTRVTAWSGRSKRVTFAFGPKISRARLLVSSPPRLLVRMIRGMSDQGGWCPRRSRSDGTSVATSASDATRMALVVSSIRAATSWSRLQISARIPARSRAWAASVASLPRGAAIRTVPGKSSAFFLFIHAAAGHASPFFLLFIDQNRNAGQHSAKPIQRWADADSGGIDEKLADGALVLAGPLLHHGEGLVDGATGFEEAKHQNRIGQIGDIDGPLHLAHHATGGDHDHGHDPLLVQVGDELVQLEIDVTFLAHGMQITVEAVDVDHLGAFFLDSAADPGG